MYLSTSIDSDEVQELWSEGCWLPTLCLRSPRPKKEWSLNLGMSNFDHDTRVISISPAYMGWDVWAREHSVWGPCAARASMQARSCTRAAGGRSTCALEEMCISSRRCMTWNEIVRLGKKRRLKVVRKKWRCCWQHTRPCVEDHLGDDWVTKGQWHTHQCNHVWRSLQSHPASHQEPFTLSQEHDQWWVFASKHLRWVTHMMSRRVSHVISEKGNPSHMWEGQLM